MGCERNGNEGNQRGRGERDLRGIMVKLEGVKGRGERKRCVKERH